MIDRFVVITLILMSNKSYQRVKLFLLYNVSITSLIEIIENFDEV